MKNMISKEKGNLFFLIYNYKNNGGDVFEKIISTNFGRLDDL